MQSFGHFRPFDENDFRNPFLDAVQKHEPVREEQQQELMDFGFFNSPPSTPLFSVLLFRRLLGQQTRTSRCLASAKRKSVMG